jgi:hypothetical protein
MWHFRANNFVTTSPRGRINFKVFFVQTIFFKAGWTTEQSGRYFQFLFSYYEASEEIQEPS